MVFSLCVHVHAWTHTHIQRERERENWVRVSISWPHLTLIIFLQALCPNTATLGVRISTYTFWRHTIQLITCGYLQLRGRLKIGDQDCHVWLRPKFIVWGWVTPSLGGCPMYFLMFSSIPDLYPVDGNANYQGVPCLPTPQLVTSKNLSKHWQSTQRGRAKLHVSIPPVENDQSWLSVGFVVTLNKIRTILIRTLTHYEKTDYEGKLWGRQLTVWHRTPCVYQVFREWGSGPTCYSSCSVGSNTTFNKNLFNSSLH